MTIRFNSAHRVNPTRPFAAGLLPPDPPPGFATAPAGPAVTSTHHARFDAAAGGDVESDPAEWPAWTDDYRVEPTPADWSWWSAESERLAAVRVDRDADARAAESAALDALELGLIPPTSPA